MKDELVVRGVDLRLGPATVEEARAEMDVLEPWPDAPLSVGPEA